MAAEKKDHGESMAQLLLDYGAEINSKDIYGSTEMHLATISGAEKMMKLLLNHGAELNSKDINGSTELHLAARSGDEKVVKLLLNHGAKIEEKDNDGYTALHWAVRAGQVTMVRLFLENGATTVGKNGCGLTLLHQAVIFDDESEALSMSQLLLKHGANPNEKLYFRSYMIAVLLLAVLRGREEIVQNLLDYGAKIDKSGTCGRSALSEAARRGHRKIVQILLDHGANPAEIDKYSHSGRWLIRESFVPDSTSPRSQEGGPKRRTDD
ncbi:hypothetical protein MMC07_006372 [Pseudocyphellaria aurata]|nr:hypothetical protein [Pseudocyphellaria aurata]